jgi:hypothetical protein
MITYFKHHQIDKTKWDLCIGQAANSMVYAYSWYLDIASPGWEALVLEDYQAVMPLTRSRKLFINYLYQPFFTQQLGVFYRGEFDEELVATFIRSIPQKFKFVDINLNEKNAITRKRVKVKKRKNYVLDLQPQYAELQKLFDEHCRRNIKKVKREMLHIKPVDIALAVAFYQKYKGALTQQVLPVDYQRLIAILEAAMLRNMVLPRGVYSESDELLAVGIFVMHKGRIIYLLGCAADNGREKRAMYLLFDDIIFHFSSHPMILDFEGSEIPGIARFFKGFGAVKRPYYKLRINRLPWFVRWLK